MRGIGHVGAVAVLEEQGFEFKRMADSRRPVDRRNAGRPNARADRRARLPALPRSGSACAAVGGARELGYAEGEYFYQWLEARLGELGVHTFADLRIADDPGADPREEHRWRLTSPAFLESVLTTTVVGRDQGYLAEPWVSKRSIEVNGLGVSPFDFTIDRGAAKRLYGRAAATDFLRRSDGTGGT